MKTNIRRCGCAGRLRARPHKPSTTNLQTSGSGGFTLIEIMIVIAIIAMLAAVAVPSYLDARNRSQMTCCIENLRTIDNAIQQWAVNDRKQSGQTVALEDIRCYLRKDPVCPSGGKSFGDSYELTTVDASPVCLRVTAGKYTHKL